jgi:hypothetical protein
MADPTPGYRVVGDSVDNPVERLKLLSGRELARALEAVDL